MEEAAFLQKSVAELESSDENWLNSAPLSMLSMAGRQVLLHFWSYSCFGCIRSIPFVKGLCSAVAKEKITVISVHTPVLAFEKNIYNLKMSVRRMDIQIPVLHDPESVNARNYGITSLPGFVLVSKGGDIILEHSGEDGMDEMRRRFVEITGIATNAAEFGKPHLPFMTRGIRAGMNSGSEIGSVKVCTKETCDEYYDPGNHREGIIYLKGDWSREPEYLAFWGNSGYISVKFNAKEASAVMDGSGHAEILYHGEPLDPDYAGTDTIFKRGRSFVSMNGPRLYSLLKLDRYMPGEIKLVPFRGFRIYSYAFG